MENEDPRPLDDAESGLPEDEASPALSDDEWPADAPNLEPDDIAAPQDAASDGQATVGEVTATATAGPGGVAAATSVLEDYQREVHEVTVELNRIETDIIAMLEGRDSRRKRKLTGTHRWHELEDDILSWRFTKRFDEDVLRRMQELIARRHYLFRHLRFLSSTRPVWNS